jgi:hypothetical protein
MGFTFDRNNYQNTGWDYAPSPPDDVFLDCPLHDCSSEDCGCIVYDAKTFEVCDIDEVYPSQWVNTCKCGALIYRIFRNQDKWWHRIEGQMDTMTCADGSTATPTGEDQ